MYIKETTKVLQLLLFLLYQQSSFPCLSSLELLMKYHYRAQPGTRLPSLSRRERGDVMGITRFVKGTTLFANGTT
jgi:hypothetical protein